MINFFRKKRKKLAEDNKALKYARYAFGEIVLVVIGILIAISINNWNKNRAIKSEELKILKSLQFELNDNYTLFKESYNFHLKRLQATTHFLLIDPRSKSISYIDSIWKISNFSHTLNPSLSIYNNLINSGKIEIISNESLKINISKFKDLIFDYKEEEIYTFDLSRDFFYNYWITNDKFKIYPELSLGIRNRTKEEEIRDINDYSEYISNESVKKFYLMVILNLNTIKEEGKDTKVKIEELLQQIDLEIKNLES